jgi:ABC-type multidrug transport system fused ATPase/permease subunit
LNSFQDYLRLFAAMGFSALADARNAVERLVEVFMAETMDDTRVINSSLDAAIEVKGATFSWDSVPTDSAPAAPKGKGGPGGKPGKAPKKPKKPKTEKGAAKGTSEEPAAHVSENPFRLDEVNLSIPRGQLVAIVGPVGSGKSSLLQGLIGGKSLSSPLIDGH